MPPKRGRLRERASSRIGVSARIAGMTTLAFDTLKLARRLESAGFSPQQAGDTAQALADSLRETSDLATKHDLNELKAELKADLKGEIASVRTEVAELKSEIYRALWLQAAGIVGVLSAVGALLKVWS